MPDVTCPNCGKLLDDCPMNDECVQVQTIMDRTEHDLASLDIRFDPALD